MIILGLNTSHNATASLLIDGEIMGCVSEERFNRKKNFFGFPKQSVDYLLKSQNLKISDVDYIVNGGKIFVPPWDPIANLNKYGFIKRNIFFLLSSLPFLEKILRHINYLLERTSTNKLYKEIITNTGVKKEQIILAPHHDCHAYTAYYGFVNDKARMERKFTVFTHDAKGDFLCATIGIAEKNKIKKIAQIKAGNSLAAIYADITALLGMKINEHEYKVMGLAPYASTYEINKVYPILEKLIEVRGLQFKSRYGMVGIYSYLRKELPTYRFDGIAGAAQKLVEEKIVQWIKNGIKKTKQKDIVLGGGLFMNVKANKIISEQKEVGEVIVCPSAGDESNAIGAAYWGYEYACKKSKLFFNPKAIKNLYLGALYTEEEITKTLMRFKKNKRIRITQERNIEKKIANSLVQGKIVARSSGKMEFGARALGNRSILADPRSSDVVKKINEKIKNRDFWMPFAPTILRKRVSDYIIKTGKIDSLFMTAAFGSTKKAQEELKAALHPYDSTLRAQILDKEMNPSYYAIIEEFEKLTGVGAVLNTSFNLHGEPIVCNPEDAVNTFLSSGLDILVLEDYFIEKI